MKTISDIYIKERMINLLRDGSENIDHVKCLFFAWYDLFDASCSDADKMIADVFIGSRIPESHREEFELEMKSVLI